MAEAIRDQNYVTVMLFESASNPGVTVNANGDEATGRLFVDVAGGSGTVTTVSIVSANGFAGSVANPTTTPAITLTTTVTGILKGNGTAISAATAGTDYVTASSTNTFTNKTYDTAGTGNAFSINGTAITAVTGTGAVVLANSPTLTTPVIGAATGTSLSVSGLLASATGLTLEETGAGTDIITLQAPASIAASYTLTLPVDDGNSGEVLSTNGSGVLSWVSAGGVPTTITVANEATDTTCFPLFVTAATGDLGPKSNAGLTFNSNTALLTATLMAATTSLTTASVLASSNDSGALGASGTAFADLFLASGGVINWAAANATITHSSGLLTTNVPVTITGVATADGFAPTATTATGNRMYLPAANTLGWAINGTGEMQLTATALSPVTDGGNSLGTTALGWQNLFGNTGFVFNLENGDWVATHTAGILTVGTGDLRVTNAGANGASVVTVAGTQTLTNKTLTSPVLTTPSAFTTGGSITLAENTSLALDPAGSADGKYTGITVTAVCGYAAASGAFGDLVYLAVADSRWEKCDADALATAGNVLIGMMLTDTVSDGGACNILLYGIIRADAKFPALTVGAGAYVGETAGAIQVAIPTGADNIIRVVGFALTADELMFNPSQDWQVTVA